MEVVKRDKFLRKVRKYKPEDITNYTFEQADALWHYADLETLVLSRGIYGMDGAILQDRNTGKLYVIKARNSTLFQLV